MLTTHVAKEELSYNFLRSHFALANFGIYGDAAVAFVGSCDISGSALVDLEDNAAGAIIRAAKMLHFIIEHFSMPLQEAVCRQRLFIAILNEEIRDLSPGTVLRRDGDDLYVEGRKLSVSIATVSPTSAVIHVGLNVDATGAPVPTVALPELGVPTEELARRALARYAEEDSAIRRAVAKVKGIC